MAWTACWPSDVAVEFLGAGYGNPSTETTPLVGPVWDPGYTREIVRAHEASGWDHVLFPYASDGPDPAQAAAWAAAHTDRIRLRVAHRPNVSAPTFAAKTFATLDTASGGRVTVHLIAGGLTSDQRAEGDDLDKDARYDRLAEYAIVLLQSWTSSRPFTHVGPYYRAQEFVLRARSPARPGLSAGGASRRALEVGARVADVFAFFGEPLAATAAQVQLLRSFAAAADRPSPRLQIAFRPIVAPTDEEAWAKARAIRARIDELAAPRAVRTLTEAPREPGKLPENTANLRLAELAASGERHDRALWTPTVAGAGGLPTSATALVGSYRTVADALLDYVDLGFEIFGLRGYDLLADAVEFGENVIPLVHAGVAARAGTTLTP
ncbi:LLM class flavin-dependent oxidoreductase [Cellulomonas sp. URHD0024]|uniref:LLM class flavin-dependent oxidoreductase n=1 Tax=Cellulomonas sp. URHD0024 TaxID=1302620 RepID=UPI001E600DBE|nr:LLM class flavin-dependent oxidoreductase [Cellulomonas sp. URHD0024]